ncbi:MAG: SpoIID/LytB domain-containing protein, partial [Actinomycetota bacterium]
MRSRIALPLVLAVALVGCTASPTTTTGPASPTSAPSSAAPTSAAPSPTPLTLAPGAGVTIVPTRGSLLVHGAYPHVASRCKHPEQPTLDARYPGRLTVSRAKDGTLGLTLTLPFERYLEGLAEVPPTWPMAALEAQAIAARTELLQKIGRRSLTDPFLLCSTQQCQVYAGAGKEDPRATRAIEKTHGFVLLRDGGGMVDIRYSASCGGHTEDNDAIWGGEADPSLRGRQDTPKTGASRVTDATLDAFLAEDPHDAWCGRGK